MDWTHYCEVLSLSTKAERTFYLREAERRNWSTRELRAQIKGNAYALARAEAETASTPDAGPPLKPRRGRLYTYRTVALSPGSVDLDLGFHIYYRPEAALEPGQILAATRETGAPHIYRFHTSRAGRNRLYTYRADLEKVVDGDTLWVRIDCGFGVHTRQKLRLRGIDAPELPDPLARKARDSVRQVVQSVPFLIITTTKADKYDRYLSDVFYLADEPDPATVARKGTFLNQQLLEEGLARRFDG